MDATRSNSKQNEASEGDGDAIMRQIMNMHKLQPNNNNHSDNKKKSDAAAGNDPLSRYRRAFSEYQQREFEREKNERQKKMYEPEEVEEEKSRDVVLVEETETIIETPKLQEVTVTPATFTSTSTSTATSSTTTTSHGDTASGL